MDDAREMLEMVKLSSGNLNTSYSTSGGNLTTTTTMSQDDFDDAVTTTDDFPPTLWENPFTLREVDAMNLVQGVNAIPTDNELANLPYRELVIDVATGVVSTIGATYTEDGILVDNWNNCNDVTFQPYCELEKHGAQGNDDAIMAVSTSASEDGDNKTIIDAEKVGCRGRRIFIVCYHLPVIVSKDPTTGVWLACWAESLLAKTEGSSFVNAYDPHWVGTVTTNSTIVDDDDRRALQAVLTDMDCTALFFDDDIRDAHYMGFCKQVLWQAFHHLDLLDMRDSLDLDSTKIKLQPDGTLRDVCSSWDQRLVGHWYEAFKTVNSTFAVEVAKLVQPDDIVWIHDYHLSLMPRLLVNEERKMTKANGGGRLTKKIFFLHVPFPPSMIFKEMECGPDILEGMLNADVVGFHGYTDARHFLSSVKRILGVAHESFEGGILGIKYRKRIVAVTMSSVSIEPPLVSAAMQLQTTIDGEAALRAKHEGRIIIAGLDVAQYLSGVELKLCIYEKLLRDSPTWRNKLVLVQRCLIPGARLLDESTSLRNIRSMVSTIQAKYGDAVIDYEEVFGSSLPLDQRLALWRSSDCLLNTEVRGGLNMLPLEFVYAQKGLEIPGTVITSEFTAVSSILNGALRISPYDMKNTLSTIDKALTMTKDERVGRHFRDIEFVSSSSSSQWIKNILRDVHVNDKEDKSKAKLLRSEIRSVAQFLEHEKDEQFTALDPKDVISAYNLSSRRVIVLDFNGTIVIKEDVDTILKRDVFGSNSDAPPLAVCESLAKLCSDPKNTVYVVSAGYD
jgi:trehalose 6-phosphate synthase/phosphatase